MIYISHRGNINGRLEHLENTPEYIDKAIEEGFDVEIDVWCINDTLFLSHDEPKLKTNPWYCCNVTLDWLLERIQKLWIHCKNVEAIVFFKKTGYSFNYFWHQEDDVTLTSHGYIWTYPGKKLTKYSVAVMPETKEFEHIETAIAICSDLIGSYKNNKK